MVLFATVTIPTDIQHALNSHQPLDWAAPTVVYAALMALRRVLLHTVAIAVIGSVVLMADGMAYPLTLPALFCALYSVALGSGPGRPAPEPAGQRADAGKIHAQLGRERQTGTPGLR